MFGTTLGGTILDDQVQTLDIPKFAQCLSECFKICGVQGQRCCFQHPDSPHPVGLLRARRERPRRRAAEQRDEVAPTDVDCHVTLPWKVMPMQRRDDITLWACGL